MDTSDPPPLSVPKTGLGDAPRDPGVASACLQSYTEKDFEGIYYIHFMYIPSGFRSIVLYAGLASQQTPPL